MSIKEEIAKLNKERKEEEKRHIDADRKLEKQIDLLCKEAVKGLFPNAKRVWASGWGHICNDSPTGWCIYDAEEDPSMDFCLVCGEPEERK